jgi:hypothetical protein
MKKFRKDVFLSAEQLNDFYNLMTDDGNKEMDFVAFEEFITFLEKNKTESEQIYIKTTFKAEQYNLIRDNILIISNIEDVGQLKEFILSKVENYNSSIFDWTDSVLSELHSKMMTFFQLQGANPLQFLNLLNIEETESYDEHCLFSVSNIKSRFIKLKSQIKLKMNKFIDNFEEFKNINKSRSSKRVLFDLAKLNQEHSESLDKIENMFQKLCSYAASLDQDIEEIKFVIEKHKLKEKELLIENSNMRNQTELLEVELANEKETSSQILLDLNLKKSKLSGFHQQISDYENRIFENQNYIENLSDQKSRLTSQIEFLESNFVDLSRSVTHDKQLMSDIKEQAVIDVFSQEKKLLTTENERLRQRVEKLQIDLDNKVSYIQISDRQITSLQKYIEEIEVFNQNIQKFEATLQPDTKELSLHNLDLELSVECIPDVFSSRISNESNLRDIAVTRITNLEVPNIPPATLGNHLQMDNNKERIRVTNLDDFQNIMNLKVNENPKSQKKDNEVLSEATYKEYVYHCLNTSKIIRVISLINNKVCLYDKSTLKQSILEINLDYITDIVISRDNPCIIEISYKKSIEVTESLVIENPSADEFINRLLKLQSLRKWQKRIDKTSLDSKRNFKNAYVNFFRDANKTGFVEHWLNSMFTTWSFAYLIQVNNVLIKRVVPEIFYYNDYKNIRKDLRIYRLDDYNLISNKQKIGLNKEFTFAIKIKNERQDLIFCAQSLSDKCKWIESLTN